MLFTPNKFGFYQTNNKISFSKLEAIEWNEKINDTVYWNFNDEMDAFLNHFGNKAVCVRGGMSDKQKQLSVDRFQEDENCMVFIGQIKAAGVGLTLTKAEIVIMNSLDWVPGNHEQAEDRAYRIGQNKTVNIYYMLIDDTIDTIIWDILNEKKKVIARPAHRGVRRLDIAHHIPDGM